MPCVCVVSGCAAPCVGLGTALQSAALPPALVVRRRVRRAGLRADVLSGGDITRGAGFTYGEA